MRRIEFEHPGPPVPKARPRVTRYRGTYTPEKSKRYQEALAWSARAAFGSGPPLEGPVTVEIEAWLPIPTSWSNKRKTAAATGQIWPTTKPDVDNLCKNALDAMNGIVYKDDAQVIKETLFKGYHDTPCLRVTVIQVHQEG